MSTKYVRNRQQRRNLHHQRPHRPDKRPTRSSPEQVDSIDFLPDKKKNLASSVQIVSNLIQQYNLWCDSLTTKATFEFDTIENNHQCKVKIAW